MSFQRPRLIAPPDSSKPSGPAARPKGRRPIPEDVLRQASRRLGIMSLVAASMWIVFGLGWLLFALVGRTMGWSRGRIGALTLVCGLGNTSFIGYPMVEALRGKEGLALAVVSDQVGCFVALAIGGALVTSIYSGARVDFSAIAKRVLSFPAFIALLIGVLVGALGGWPEPLDRTSKTSGAQRPASRQRQGRQAAATAIG